MTWLAQAITCTALLAWSTAVLAGENRANDYLLAVPPKKQAETLARVVGEGCQGWTAFYMGIGSSGIAENKAFWSLRCYDQKAYVVQVNPDGTGSFLGCALFEAVKAGKCFHKLDP